MIYIKKLNEMLNATKHLTVELQKAHWFVRGESFTQLHEFFEEFYGWSFDLEDKIAELIMFLDGKLDLDFNMDYHCDNKITNDHIGKNKSIFNVILNHIEKMQHLNHQVKLNSDGNQCVELFADEVLTKLNEFHFKLKMFKG